MATPWLHQWLETPPRVYQVFEKELQYYSDINEETKEWIHNLQHIWNHWKRIESVKKVLDEYFEAAPNPYLSTLRVLVNIPDFMSSRSGASLSKTVIGSFINWIESTQHSYRNCLTDDLKLAAFRLVSKQKSLQLTKLVANIYEFQENLDLFVPILKDVIIRRNNYKEAAQIIVMLNMQYMFGDPEVLLFPLILQSKVNVVEEFLNGQPEMQKNFVSFLDNLLSPNIDLENHIQNFTDCYNVPDVQMSLVCNKAFSKLVGRLAKQYNLPIDEVCPNLSRYRNEGALKFIMHKRYRQKDLNLQSFREMAKEAVGSDINLQADLMRRLASYDDISEALYFARLYNIPRMNWPFAMSHIDEETYSQVSNDPEENLSVNQDEFIQYHELKLPRNCIKIVDNITVFDELIDHLRSVDIVGIDSEWKPSFGTKKTELALIQIATKTNVYILDVTTIGNELQESWKALSLILFKNKNILKLGFDVTQDIAMMKQVIPAFQNIRSGDEGYFDLLQLWRKIKGIHNFQFPYVGDKNFSNETLSKLVELCLGNRLNKSDQFSNWELRPLRESQIVYAALDAYCLLEIYEVIFDQCLKLSIPFWKIRDKILNVSLRSPKRSKKPPAKMNDELVDKDCDSQLKEEVVYEPVNAHNFRAICDYMLGGLAKQLRMCGCDVEYLEIVDDKLAQIALKKNRTLLTKGKRYKRMSQFFNNENIYNVVEEMPEYQMLEVIKHFQVTISLDNIFSICIHCNANEFAYINTQQMRKLIERYIELTKPNRHLRQMLCNASTCEAKGESTESRSNRTWHLNKNSLNLDNCTTIYRARVRIPKIPQNVLRDLRNYYVCEGCGQVYWDGSLLEKTLTDLLKTNALLIN